MALVPPAAEWPDFMAADRAFFASQGGDASIGARLPALYRKAGLLVQEVVPTIKSGAPGSAVWNWMSNYFLGVMDRYAAFPPFDAKKARRLARTWRRAATAKHSLLIAPTLLDLVGKKPR
jgi:hypothetical protein